jgi:RsmE family RNA methyltransferase
MNIILFQSEELSAPLSLHDRRARHMLQVLGLKPGDPFKMGVVDGPRGEGTLSSIDENTLHFSFKLESAIPELHPLTLLVGLPRPQTAKKIIREVTTLGAAQILFFNSERGHKSYAQSPIWEEENLRQLLLEGAEQAFCTRLPEVKVFPSLQAGLGYAPEPAYSLAFDNEIATVSLLDHLLAEGERLRHVRQHFTLIIGSERGLSSYERKLLAERDFNFTLLGRRVLRTETAAVSATAILLAALGWM